MAVVVLLLLTALGVGIGLALMKAKRELPPCFLLAVGDDGLEMFKARRDRAQGGVRHKGTLYPDELLDDLGYSTYALADSLQVPSDGDLTHGGDWPNLKPVSQRVMVASWQAYNTARRRLNWSSVFQRGDGSLSALKNVGLAVVVVVNFYMGFAVWGLRAETGQLRTSLVVVSGQLARLTGVGTTTVPAGSVANPRDNSLVPAVPTQSRPAGDPGRQP